MAAVTIVDVAKEVKVGRAKTDRMSGCISMRAVFLVARPEGRGGGGGAGKRSAEQLQRRAAGRRPRRRAALGTDVRFLGSD